MSFAYERAAIAGLVGSADGDGGLTGTRIVTLGSCESAGIWPSQEVWSRPPPR